MSGSFTYIILENRVLLSKRQYNNWREIQDEYYEEYKANLGPFTLEEFCDYLSDDFKEEENWPFSKQQIVDFLKIEEEILENTK